MKEIKGGPGAAQSAARAGAVEKKKRGMKKAAMGARQCANETASGCA